MPIKEAVTLRLRNSGTREGALFSSLCGIEHRYFFTRRNDSPHTVYRKTPKSQRMISNENGTPSSHRINAFPMMTPSF